MYESGDRSGVRADQVRRILGVLADLETSQTAAEMNIPGYRLHPLKGDLKGFWSVTVSGNWRIVFRFEDGQVVDVDPTDYH